MYLYIKTKTNESPHESVNLKKYLKIILLFFFIYINEMNVKLLFMWLRVSNCDIINIIMIIGHNVSSVLSAFNVFYFYIT